MNSKQQKCATVKAFRLLLTAVLLTVALGVPLVPVAHAATITVNSTADNTTAGDGNCTLREAINNANSDSDTTSGDCTAGSGDDTINFSVTGTITLGGTELTISTNLTITGPGASSLAISGSNSSRVFRISSGTVTISGLTIRDGQTTYGGGIRNDAVLTIENCAIVENTADPGSGGGGIANFATLTIRNTEISGNVTRPGASGGGIYNSGGLTIENSLIYANQVLWQAGGGGVANFSSASINNTTISGNRSFGAGGGILNTNSLNLTNVTITSNEAYTSGGPYLGLGGGIRAENGTINFKNTIIAVNVANYDGPDCSTSSHFGSSGTVNSQDYNLIQDTTDCTIGGATGNNITGQDPLLGSLADNGGDTQTHALQTGSPAIEQIPDGTNDCQAGVSTDQRGAVRAGGTTLGGGDKCEIGAYEYGTSMDATLMELASFTATGHDGYVLVEWETASEIDNAGFNLWRSETEAGPYTKLKDRLIPARGGPTIGARYSFRDDAVTNGVTYWYKLEDVDIHGVSTMHGPVPSTSLRRHCIYLPLLVQTP